ncbi:Hypothetical protein CLAU_2538 [Clostridium autoethanogenum DSM 10061]|nr:Hypothetical protein CLAU_2538 [Clostridium autoethanogenum DSM 10061]OVY50344.1 hypothetical protein WX72_02416 [Clostridium autoethanogenum]
MNPFVKTSIEKIKYAVENNKLNLIVGTCVSMNSKLF